VLQARVAKLEAASSGRTLSNAKELHRSLDYFQNSFSKLVKSVKKAYPVTDNEAPNAYVFCFLLNKL
jgi:phage anti-repressor protein